MSERNSNWWVRLIHTDSVCMSTTLSPESPERPESGVSSHLPPANKLLHISARQQLQMLRVTLRQKAGSALRGERGRGEEEIRRRKKKSRGAGKYLGQWWGEMGKEMSENCQRRRREGGGGREKEKILGQLIWEQVGSEHRFICVLERDLNTEENQEKLGKKLQKKIQRFFISCLKMCNLSPMIALLKRATHSKQTTSLLFHWHTCRNVT